MKKTPLSLGERAKQQQQYEQEQRYRRLYLHDMLDVHIIERLEKQQGWNWDIELATFKWELHHTPIESLAVQ